MTIVIREEQLGPGVDTFVEEARQNRPRITESARVRFAEMYADFLERPNLHNQLRMQEAMGTADFPYLLADTIERSLLAEYEAVVPNWSAWCATGIARDFREFKYLDVTGGRGVYSEVEEFANYPERHKTDNAPITGKVAKWGGRFGISLEMIVNDDLGALRRLPGDLALAARRTEAKLVTSTYVAATGPDTTLYSADHGNIITGNPALSGAALASALGQLGNMVDADGEPIIFDMVTLVCPPALEMTANNIANTIQWENVEAGATANQKAYVRNWLSQRFRIEVDHYHPIVCTDANKKNTSWYLFASSSAPRPAIELRHLAGFETPMVFGKAPDSMRIGGGGYDSVSFENDTQEYKGRHICGALQVEPKATLASNGSGS